MNDEEKKKLKRYLCIAVLILILIPLALDRFFAHEGYMIWFGRLLKVKSPMDVGEWFGFLGSYLGVVGTIIIGIIAYWQTHIINKQSEHLSDLQKQLGLMQKEINDFQIHPIIRIKAMKIQVKNNLGTPRVTKQEMEAYYFAVYGEHWLSNGIRYIMVSISFEDKAIIPTVQCEVSDLKWDIADNEFQIKLRKNKRKINHYDEIKILIEDEDNILPDRDAFFQAVDLHEHYKNSGICGYDKSILTINLNFINQKGYMQPYILRCQIESNSEGLIVDSNFCKIV